MRPRSPTLDVLAIEGLAVSCVVGVYPVERERPQPLRIDIRMALDTHHAGESQRLRRTVDYAMVASQIAFILQTCRFYLLETAAQALTRYLLAPPALGEDRARIQAVTLRLTKPHALAGNGVPSLEVHRSARDVHLVHEEKAFGTVDIVYQTRDTGIYRLNIAPGRGIPLHEHRVMTESEMILGEGLLVNGREAPAGTVHRWPFRSPHQYDNPTDRWQSILCMDSPRFLPEDEVEVAGVPVVVTPEPPFLPRHPVVGA